MFSPFYPMEITMLPLDVYTRTDGIIARLRMNDPETALAELQALTVETLTAIADGSSPYPTETAAELLRSFQRIMPLLKYPAAIQTRNN